MKIARGFLVIFVVCATLVRDIKSDEGKNHEEGRDLREYNQDWRAVDYASSAPDTWVQTENEQKPKRRRVRKRKRRPPVFEEEVYTLLRRRPQRLDEMKEPWEEMSSEIVQKTNSRRRLTPIYDATEEVQYEKIRDPFTALQEAEEKQKSKIEENVTKTSDLKTLLKQNGGLSLSEVLQQKNLSLSELLEGKEEAISALVREAETTTETVTTTRKSPTKKIEVSRNFQRSSELTSREVTEAQRKRFSLLHGHKEPKLFSGITTVDVVTEETTERRIFVPSNLRTGATTATIITSSSFRPKIRKLPMTSAKLKNLVTHTTQETTSQIPEKAVSINVNEILGLETSETRKEIEPSDVPLKMTIDLVELVTQKSEDIQTTLQNFGELTRTLPTTTATSVKLKRVTAKEEILEILKDPVEGERLSNILHTRNMTVEELVAQRERGSSQLHLADIFHNKTREPEPIDELLIGQIQFDTSSNLNRQPKTLQVVTTEKPPTTKFPYTITSFPTYKIETNKDVKSQPFLPIWQQLYPSFFTDVYENNHLPDTQEVVPRATTTTEKISYEELERLEEIENALAEAANEQLKVDLPQNIYEDDDDDMFIKLPSGVKSAILASLAIVGLSLIVFLTILVIFKWSQKQKRRLNYNGSFSGSKIRSPILESDRRTFRNFVSETLGRKKNYYKAHLQSMSDSIWDQDEKKSYMI